jgi:hypothetical protein
MNAESNSRGAESAVDGGATRIIRVSGIVAVCVAVAALAVGMTLNYGLTFGVLGIVAAAVAMGVLVLSLNVASRWLWWIKAGATVVVFWLWFTTYVSVAALVGWPTTESPPVNFQLHWSKIVEPNQFNQDPGAIYLWLEALDENNVPNGVPRSFVLPYDDQLADQLLQANDKIKEGEEVAGTAETIVGDPDEEEELDPAEEDEEKQAGQRPDDAGGGFLPENFDPELLTLTFQDMPEIVQPDKSPF